MQNVPNPERPSAPGPLWLPRRRPDHQPSARQRRDPDPGVWLRPDMRRLLARRDLAGVFRLLQVVGASQRWIAAQTGQGQSEISEILAGRRVSAYDVLLRVAAGFGVPRGWLGLDYDPDTAARFRPEEEA